MSNDWLRDRAEHFARLRTDPTFRMLEQLEDMRAEMMPPLYPQQDPPTKPEPLPATYSQDKSFDYAQDKSYERATEALGIANYTKQKIQEHLASYPKKKRGKYD